MKKNLIFCLALVMTSLTVFTGCNKEAVTVADNLTASSSEDGESEYIEIEDFKTHNSTEASREGIGGLTILIPTDFVRSEDVPGMYISKRYPLDSGNIYYTKMDSSDIGAISDELTKDGYIKAVEDAYEAMGNPISLKVESFSKETIEGVPCYKIRSRYNIGDRDVEQLAYIIMAADTHVVTYSQASDDDLLADFKNDEGQIKLVREISQAEK